VTDPFQDWQQRVTELLAAYAHKVSHGNLRSHCFHWQGEGQAITNLAVVYELPGGSSSQLNQSFHHREQVIHFLNGQGEECLTSDPAQAAAWLAEAVHHIPTRRAQSLREQIERWFGEGKSCPEIFREINQFLQTDFRGGTLTHAELKAGIRYVLEVARRPPPP